MNAWRIACAGLTGALLTAGAGAAVQHANLVALKAVERGQWNLRSPDGRLRKLCVTDPAALLQIRHAANNCSHVVMDNTPRTATIRYSCTGHGQGRTTITVETSKLLQIDTQGVADGIPFAEEYEARLIGRCN